MIQGRLDAWRDLQGVQGLEAGFEFLEKSGLASLPPGKHQILGDAVYAMVMQSPSRAPEAGQFEAHRNYIDIQYLLSGEEVIGLTPVEGLQVVTPYDAAKDVVFYAAPESYRRLAIHPGHFAVFFPQEAHLPMCHSQHPHDLHKVVVKVSLAHWEAHRKRG